LADRKNEVRSRSESDPDGPITANVVEEVFVRLGRILHLHVGGEVIRTTIEHPFWVYNRGWVRAEQLGVGDMLVSDDGQVKLVEDVLDTGEYETVYNVRVADFHTYFVGGTAWGFSVWAHNAACALAAAIEALGAKLTSNQVRAILAAALRDDANAATAVARLRVSLVGQGVALTPANEEAVFNAALKGTRLDGANVTPYLLPPPPPAPAGGMTIAEFNALPVQGTGKNACRVLAAANGKEVLIYGGLRGSSTTPGHYEAMLNQAVRLAETGKYSKISLQSGWGTATGELDATNKLLPDIIAVQKNGVVDAWEVWSDTDILKKVDLRGKLKEGMDSLPLGRRGIFDVLDPEPPPHH
jgi:intein/homing endonuclease